jgi:hypothetical protein
LQNLDNKQDNLQDLLNTGVMGFLDPGKHNPTALDSVSTWFNYTPCVKIIG